MFRVQVCATHLDGFLGPKFSRQGSLFWQIYNKHGWIIHKLAKNSQKIGRFLPKLIIGLGMTASFGN